MEGTQARTFRAWRAARGPSLSTSRLVDHNPAARKVLERVLDDANSALHRVYTDLDDVLARPFYAGLNMTPTRFRGPIDPGVLYAADHRRTACAESGYWRWRVVKDSNSLTGVPPSPQWLIQLGVSGQMVDLRQPPHDAHRAQWTDPANYAPTQEFARHARAHELDGICYESVRDPEHGGCVAVLRPAALQPKKPVAREVWLFVITANGVIWEYEGSRFAFQFA